jgi:hypothetical protein
MSPRILLVVAFASLASAQLAPPDPIEQLRWVEHSDPKADLKRNIELGDTRFLVFNGISGNMRPGQASEERVAKHGIRLIEGTTDAPLNKEHDRLIRIAIKYAERYNDLLLDYLKAHE